MSNQKRAYQICTNCVMDTSDSKIIFDDKGMCDHCHNFYENILPNWHTDERGKKALQKMIQKIRNDGKGKKHDCLIGLSGGVDSSYVVYKAVTEWGLKPLVLTIDTGWNAPIAVENIQKMVTKLDLSVHHVIVNFAEMADLQLAFFKSQVAYQDTPQDHVIFASLYKFAAKEGFKYIITGGNFSTECVREPNEWVHCNDLTLIKDIHRRFGKISLKTLPLCGIFTYRLLYRYVRCIKVVKMLDMIPYQQDRAIQEMEKNLKWQRYINKHYESVFTRFYEGYWLIKKFGYDKRRCYYSSLILTGQISREDALELLKKPPYDDATAMQDMKSICDKLGVGVNEFLMIMGEKNKTYNNYKSGFALISAATNFARLIGMERRNFR